MTAFLSLESIATVPLFSRRFRDRHPIVLFALARRHGCANAMNAASLDAIAATGRDWSMFAGGEKDDWWGLPAPRYCEGTFDLSMNSTDDGVRYIELTTTGETNHGGGLVKRFNDSDGLLCAPGEVSVQVLGLHHTPYPFRSSLCVLLYGQRP